MVHAFLSPPGALLVELKPAYGWGDSAYCRTASMAGLHYLAPILSDNTVRGLAEYTRVLSQHVRAVAQGEVSRMPCPVPGPTQFRRTKWCWDNCYPSQYSQMRLEGNTGVSDVSMAMPSMREVEQ